MRIAVLGSGGIGGYYGTRLANAGHDVVFVARGAHLEAMQHRGLTVRTPEGETTIAVMATADTSRVGPVDLVLFCVKSFDTEPAARALKPLMASDTTVLTLQNGIDNASGIAEIVGTASVLPGAVYVALQLPHPDVVVRTGGEGRIVFGEPAGALLLFIAGIGGVTTLARSGIGPLLAGAEGRALLTASCEEIVAVARAERVALPADTVNRAIEQAAALPPQWRSSMARDLDDRRRLEVDALSGAVVRRGLRFGVPAPIHRTIVACLSVHQPFPPTTTGPPPS